MFERLLVAIDDSASGPVAVSFAAALARTHGAVVQVVHVNSFVLGGRGHTVLTTAEARDLVARAVRELRESGVPATGLVCRATPIDVPARLAEVAARWGADALVVGSRRLHRFPRLRGQGIREGLVRHSTLPVLAAPAPLHVDAGVPPVFPASPAEPVAH